jgi:hypothetical protein
MRMMTDLAEHPDAAMCHSIASPSVPEFPFSAQPRLFCLCSSELPSVCVLRTLEFASRIDIRAFRSSKMRPNGFMRAG